MEKSKIVYYKEGIEANVMVKKNEKNELFLRINGKTDAGTGLDMDTQLLSGHLPMLLHPKPENVLVVGLGSGITLGAVEQYGEVKTIEAVEIEKGVVEAASLFSEANHNIFEDKRLKMVVGDGRNYLLNSKKKYDVISS